MQFSILLAFLSALSATAAPLVTELPSIESRTLVRRLFLCDGVDYHTLCPAGTKKIEPLSDEARAMLAAQQSGGTDGKNTTEPVTTPTTTNGTVTTEPKSSDTPKSSPAAKSYAAKKGSDGKHEGTKLYECYPNN